MIKKLFILLVTKYLLLNTVFSQNLVIDGSFEDISICPHLTSAIIDSSNNFWKTIPTHGGSSNHFNTCAPQFPIGFNVPNNRYGFQDTCDLNSYVGGYIFSQYPLDSIDEFNYREYLTGEFTDSLKQNFCYKVSFKYSLAEKDSRYAINNYGIYFSKNFPTNNAIGLNYNNLNYNPQIEVNQYLHDTENWVKIERFYSAQGGEKYLTLGNFNSNNNTDTLLVNDILDDFGNYISYLYIDDVIVEEVPFQTLGELNLGGDTILCKGEVLTFDNILPDSTVYVWNQLSNDTTFTIDSSGQYILEAYNGCSFTSDTINVEFVEPIVELGNDTSICKREQVVLANNNETANHPKANYLWSTGDTTAIITQSDSGLYWLKVNVEHCQDADTIIINYQVPENATFMTHNSDTLFCVSGILDASSSAWNDKYVWNTDDETQTIEITESGEYSVYAENECTEASSTFNVKVETLEEGLNNYNIITPNSDFMNDLFNIYEGNSEQYQIQIYNRWGKLVWQSDEPTNHWNGSDVNDGNYFYHLSFRNCAGETVEQKGTVEVKR